MYGKSLKELNTKLYVKKINYKNYVYEKISSEKEFSYFRIKLSPNTKYKIKDKSFYLFLNKGSVIINKKKYTNSSKEVLFSKNSLCFQTITRAELYVFFLKKISKLNVIQSQRIFYSKISILPINRKKKYWGYIYDLLQNKKGAIKIIEMNINTQSSMEFHIKKKRKLFS